MKFFTEKSLEKMNTILCERGVSRWGAVALNAQDLNRSVVFQRTRRAFRDYLSEGMHGGMFFLTQNALARENPDLILPGARSAVVFAIPYAVRDDFRPSGEAWNFIARYAWVRDYHKSIKKFLSDLGDALAQELGPDFSSRPVVDSVPFWERAVAQMAGLGGVGKNTCLISQHDGSFVFLAALITNYDFLDYAGVAEEDICGECLRCQGACPTRAFLSPYRLDARRCLAYWSIEHRGIVPDEFVPYFSRTIFGCDICQSVCPHNRKKNLGFAPREVLTPVLGNGIRVVDIAMMSEQQYERWFGGTALTRAKREGLVRNALYHLYAVGSEFLEPALYHCENGDTPHIASVVRQIRGLQNSSLPR